MKISSLMILLQLITYALPSMAGERSPESVVRKLYQEVIARRPLGIPKGEDKTAVWPFLSKRLIQRLETAQACEGDYFRQHAADNGKPDFGWLETGLFSGENEEALPAEAILERTEPQKDGSFLVHVRLTYKETGPYGPSTFHWNVAARVISEGGRFLVDDILLFKEDSTEVVRRRLSDSFAGCEGARWIGRKTGHR